MRHSVTINGGTPHDIPAALLQSYLLEQMRLNGWQVLTYGGTAGGGQEIQCRDKHGELRLITVAPAEAVNAAKE